MKTIIYIGISLSVAFNSCQENNQSKTSITETTEIISEKKVIDILDKNISAVNDSENNTQSTTDNKTNTATERKTISENQKEYFKLLSAVSENWTAGIPSGGSGTEYYIKVKITTSDKIVFDTLWTNNKAFEIFISKESSSISSEPIKYGKGDIIAVRATELKNQNIKSTQVAPPINYNGAALIGYSVNEKREYFIVKEIKKQSSPNRP